MMKMPGEVHAAWGYRWRSSTVFISITLMMAMLTTTFLYGTVVPILPYMLERRMGLDPSNTQTVILSILTENALVSAVFSPATGYLGDRVSSRKPLLLMSMVVALASTIAMAVVPSLYGIFTARFFQAIADNFMWTLSFATLGDTAPQGHVSMMMGLANFAISIGTSFGPMVSGLLLETSGYWASWSGAFGLLTVDIILRLLMIEKPKRSVDNQRTNASAAENEADTSTNDPERTQLLPKTTTVEEKTGLQYYTYVLCQRRFLSGALCYVCSSLLLTTFDTTLPLHVSKTFNWNSGPAGLLFIALQAPGIVLNPLCGWLKDRVGSRVPTAMGFLWMAPFFWMMGAPGRFSWADDPKIGPTVYILCVLMVGCLMCLFNGVGPAEASVLVEEIERKHPGIFGANGGQSRAMGIMLMCWTLGMLFGPIISGLLTDHVGYYEMNVVLAGICLVAAANAWLNLGKRLTG